MNWKPISELTEEHKDGRILLFTSGDIAFSRLKRFGVFDRKKNAPEHLHDKEGLFDVDYTDGDILGVDCDYEYFLEIPNLPAPELKITEEWVGKYVKLRDGRKAYIATIIPFECSGGVVLGAFFDGESWETDISWYLDGYYYNQLEGRESNSDIIGLWE